MIDMILKRKKNRKKILARSPMSDVGCYNSSDFGLQTSSLILLLFIFFTPLNNIFAQARITFEASTDAKQVLMGSYFELSFTLTNGEGKNFTPPKLKDNFILLNKTPFQQTSITGINGKYTKTISYTYSLQPKKIGKFKIGSASIQVNGKIVKTKPLIIEVLKGKKNSANSKDDLTAKGGADIFIKAELNTEEARVGQQIILDYKLYTTTNIENYNITSESAYPGFFAQEIRRFNSRVVREVIDGVQYSTKILKRVALFPQQTGLLAIDPLYMQLGIAIDNPNKRRNFFSFRQLNYQAAQTDEIKLNVKPLPSNPPSSFTGGVGKFSISSSVNRNTLSTDDALAIRMTIIGDGDIKRVQAPPLILSDTFEVYDPKVIDEKSFETGGQLKAKKVVEYLVLPKHPGEYNIQPKFSYFDVDSANYVTTSPELFHLVVRKGTNKAANLNVSPKAFEPKGDIRFIKTTTQLSQKTNSFFASSIFWVFLFIPFLVLGSVFVGKKIQESRANIDGTLLKQRQAKKLAQKRLAQAKKHLDKNEAKAFYDEVSRASFGYVCDKLNIPFSELTKANVQEKLQSLNVSQNNIDAFMKIIHTCELALFAGKDNANAMNETYHSAIDDIAKIEAEIGSNS